tara:strand:- start:568 stop:789 length:222 start_codon:yes stop_codon:yes gene_type:complete
MAEKAAFEKAVELILTITNEGMQQEMAEYGLDVRGEGTEQFERFRKIHMEARRISHDRTPSYWVCLKSRRNRD